jgi:hypothetical protein
VSEISVTPGQLKEWAQELRQVAAADVSVCQESTKDLVAFVGSRPQDDVENQMRGRLPSDVVGPAVARLVTAMSLVVSRFGLYASETAGAVDKAAGVVEELDLKVGSQATNRVIPGVDPSPVRQRDDDGSNWLP